jgi:hypothetical protein
VFIEEWRTPAVNGGGLSRRFSLSQASVGFTPACSRNACEAYCWLVVRI